jgi:uncharacterized protein YvpB
MSVLGSLGVSAFGPSASSWGGDRLDAFVRGNDQALWHRWRDQGAWHWESLGGNAMSDPSAVSWASGRIDVFTRGIGGTLWHRWYSNGWFGWESLGGQLASEPAALSLASGTLDVFVQGTDAALWRAHYDAAGWRWTSLGGRLAAAPSVTSGAPGRADVLVQGVDLRLWHNTVIGAAGTWENVGGRLGSGPSAISTGPGLLDVFMRGTDNLLWDAVFNGGWQFRSDGGRLNGRPTAAWAGTGGPHALVVGLDSMLWHWSNGAWDNLGGPVAYTVAAVSAAPGTFDIFAQGTSNALLHRQWSGAPAAWDSAGGVLLNPSDPVTIPMAVYRQTMNLDCETGALQMALNALGHYYTQSTLFALEKPDTRRPVLGANNRVLQWGDPYTNFVGDVNGSDIPPTGYGIYYPVLVDIAHSHGAPFAAGAHGYSAASVYNAVASGHPVEVWVETGWKRPPFISTWTAWDGRVVPYTLIEHTVTLSGVSPGSVRVNDPWHGTQYWVTKGAFETSWADFNNMAIVF